MGWTDFFKKKKKTDTIDPLSDLTLDNLRVGSFVDRDMKTWEVTACNHYDWGDGDMTREWQLKSGDETVYLEQETDDETFWSLNRKIAFNRLGPDVRNHLLEHENPPDEIELDGTRYYLENSSGGRFFKDGAGAGRELIKWEYEDDSGKKYLSIEQWGEDNFEASTGHEVEEYQFTNILPPAA